MKYKINLRRSSFETINKFRWGVLGGFLLFLLLCMTFYTLIIIPSQVRQDWSNPLYWVDNPKDAAPIWLNYLLAPFNTQLPEHKIFTQKDATFTTDSKKDFKVENYTFAYDHHFNDFPSEFSIPFSLKMGNISPIIEVSIKRPDGLDFKIFSNSIESTTDDQSNNVFLSNSGSNISSSATHLFSQRIYSSSQDVLNSLSAYSGKFNFSTIGLSSQKIIFSKTDLNVPLKGKYEFTISVYSFDNQTVIKELKLILNGKVFGLLGTDDFRRDVFFGLLIGTPVAIFIGVTVALSSTIIGLFYGLIAGYKGKKSGTFMLTIVDIFMSVPTLLILIIISLHFGRNLLFLAGLLIIFGWPGLALLNRTFSLQIKNYQYVEASKLMGESDFKIILRHIVPQLLPFTLANFALSVPAAILAESAISFLGLGDPSYSTWGQMLEEAHSSSAEILGYWWWIVSPGFMISMTSVSFILIGRSLENLLKIKRKR